MKSNKETIRTENETETASGFNESELELRDRETANQRKQIRGRKSEDVHPKGLPP